MNELPRQTVLVADDIVENLMVLDEILHGDYNVRVATSGQKCLDIAQSETPPDLILLDVMMPGMDGFQVCENLKRDGRTCDIPVIFVTAMGEVDDEAHGLALGAVDYILKPVSPAVVKARVKTHLALYDQNRELERRVRERTRELNETRLQIIRRLGRAGEFRDNETGMHVIRVSHYCRLMAEAMNLNNSHVEQIFLAAPMHDIGKIGVPDRILLKPGKLEPDEFALMQRHAEIGSEILGDQDAGLLGIARTIALTHHEKWNGAGYPHGLKEHDIPIEGRITAIADVFDALTSERPYKRAWSVDEAVTLIQSEAGKHFDPTLVDIFMKVLPEVVAHRDRYADPAHSSGQENALT